MPATRVTLCYSGSYYSFNEDPDRFLKGKLACDCTKAALIRIYCDPEFPLLACGDKIAIVSMVDLAEEPERTRSRS